MKKILGVLLAVCILAVSFVGCTQSERVSQNISKEADNFNVVRRLTVINARTDSPLFELIGTFSLSNNSSDELVITCQTGINEFKKHYVYVNKEWTLYVVEDISGANVSPYHYEITFLPETVQPFTFEVDGKEHVRWEGAEESQKEED